MKTIEISTASEPLSAYAKRLDDEIIILTSKTKPVAALVSLKKVSKESLSLSTSPEFMEIVNGARKEFSAGKKLSFDEMKQAVSEMD